jgi:hypothetical protein
MSKIKQQGGETSFEISAKEIEKLNNELLKKREERKK